MACTHLVQMRMVAPVAEWEHEYKALLSVLVTSLICEITGVRNYDDSMSTTPNQNLVNISNH